MGKNPAFLFYPGDWIQDTRFLSNEAKGAWIDILCAMWRSPEKGKLGPLDVSCFAKLIGEDNDTARTILNELIGMKICDCEHDCNGIVTISNRRMVREQRDRTLTRNRVKRHRNAKEKRVSNAKVTPPSSVTVTVTKKELTTSFERFWKVWLKKVDRAEALSVWLTLKPDETLIEKICKNVEGRMASEEWTKEGRQFCPGPAKYLRKRKWEDEDSKPLQEWVSVTLEETMNAK